MMLTIDPGLSDPLGWATWRMVENANRVREVGLARFRKEWPWQQRVEYAFGYVTGLLIRLKPKLVVCEMPQNWLGSRKGFASAAKGSTLKLAYLVGGIHALCTEYGIAFKEVEVNTWKGQMSKRAVYAAIRRALGPRPRSLLGQPLICNHIADAVGIGLYMKGLLHAPASKQPAGRPGFRRRRRAD